MGRSSQSGPDHGPASEDGETPDQGPIRTCLGCRRRVPQADLVRLGWDGKVVLIGRTIPGRGAWVHQKAACLAVAIRPAVLSRAFRARINPSAIEQLSNRVLERA